MAKSPIIGTPATWQMVSYEGNPDGIEGERELTVEALEQIVSNFNDKSQTVQCPIFKDHCREPGDPAVGYVLDLRLKEMEDGSGRTALWALIEFIPEMYPLIWNKQYSYFSIEFYPDMEHQVTGEQVGAWMEAIAFAHNPHKSEQSPIDLANKVQLSKKVYLSRKGCSVDLKELQKEKDKRSSYLSNEAEQVEQTKRIDHSTEKSVMAEKKPAEEKPENKAKDAEEQKEEMQTDAPSPLLDKMKEILGSEELTVDEVLMLLDENASALAELLNPEEKEEEQKEDEEDPKEKKEASKLGKQVAELLERVNAQDEQIKKLNLSIKLGRSKSPNKLSDKKENEPNIFKGARQELRRLARGRN